MIFTWLNTKIESCVDMNKEIDAGIKDPLVDITSFQDNTLGEGFGIELDSSVTSHTGNIVHQNMIKR